MDVASPSDYLGLSIDPRIARRLLGTRVLLADLLWIDTMFKSDLSREGLPFSPFYRAFVTITELDPDNLYAYYIAGLYLSVVKDDIRGATAILRKGVQYMESNHLEWAGAWVLEFTLGYNLLYEEHEIESGSEYIRKAAALPGAPAHVASLAKHVSTEQGRLEVASRLLSMAYKRVTKPEDKSRIERKMLDVAARQQLVEVNERYGQFLKSTGAYAFPPARRLQLFFRATGTPKKDMLGRPLGLDATGRIAPL